MKRQRIFYVGTPTTPMPRRVRRGRWEWEITDGQTGEVLASGHTWTEGGALRARLRAEVDCEPIAWKPKGREVQAQAQATRTGSAVA